MIKGVYLIAPMKRLLNFAFPVYQIGWMPHHQSRHCHAELKETFFCFSFNRDSGGGVVEVNGELRRGSHTPTFSMLPAGTRLNTIETTLHDELFISYQATTDPHWQKLFGCTRFNFQHVTPDSSLRLIISQLREELNNLHRAGTADNLDRLAFSFITGMFIAEQTRQQDGTENNLHIEELAAELQQGHDLEHLIRKYGFSRRNFFRLWKTFCPQMTPTQYRLAHQMNKAETLLKQSDLPIHEIAQRAGFTSDIYFSRIFRQRHSCTPSQYRQRQSQLDIPEFQDR